MGKKKKKQRKEGLSQAEQIELMNEIIKGNIPVDAIHDNEPVESYKDYDEGYMSPSDFMKMIDEEVSGEEEDNNEVKYEEPVVVVEPLHSITNPLTEAALSNMSIEELLSRIDEEEEYEDEFDGIENSFDDEDDENEEEYPDEESNDEDISVDEEKESETDNETVEESIPKTSASSITFETISSGNESTKSTTSNTVIDMEMPTITFERKTILGREIFSLSDGIKRMDVDISTLDKDTSTDALFPDGLENYSAVEMIADAFIEEILNLCYPSAAFAGNALFKCVKTIDKCSKSFKFTTYENTSAILAYYISSESRKTLIDTLIEYKDSVAGNLLFVLRGHLWSDGFNFQKVNKSEFIDYVNKDEHAVLQEAYLSMLMNDPETEFCDGSDNEDLTDTGVAPIPWGLTNDYLTDILDNVIGNVTEEESDESDGEAKFATEGSVFDDEELNKKEESVETTITVEETVTTKVEVTEESSEESNDDSLFSDVEEAEEEISFDAKPAVEQPKQEIEEESSDDEFVVKRRF